jgi:hypothetical protein
VSLTLVEAIVLARFGVPANLRAALQVGMARCAPFACARWICALCKKRVLTLHGVGTLRASATVLLLFVKVEEKVQHTGNSQKQGENCAGPGRVLPAAGGCSVD